MELTCTVHSIDSIAEHINTQIVFILKQEYVLDRISIAVSLWIATPYLEKPDESNDSCH
jgi:hypothetical protein